MALTADGKTGVEDSIRHHGQGELCPAEHHDLSREEARCRPIQRRNWCLVINDSLLGCLEPWAAEGKCTAYLQAPRPCSPAQACFVMGRSKARPGEVRQGETRHGKARPGMVRRDGREEKPG